MSAIVKLCNKTLISWYIAECGDTSMDMDKEYNSTSFIAKVLRNKLKEFQVPIEIPDYLLILIELCTSSNPGISQVMLKEIMSHIPDLEPGYEIESSDFTRVYPSNYPIMDDNPKWEKHFEELWLAQKDKEGNNLCDTPEWWLEVFN